MTFSFYVLCVAYAQAWSGGAPPSAAAPSMCEPRPLPAPEAVPSPAPEAGGAEDSVSLEGYPLLCFVCQLLVLVCFAFAC